MTEIKEKFYSYHVWTRISKHFQMCRITKGSNFPPFFIQVSSYQTPDSAKEKWVNSTCENLRVQREWIFPLYHKVRRVSTLLFAAKVSSNREGKECLLFILFYFIVWFLLLLLFSFLDLLFLSLLRYLYGLPDYFSILLTFINGNDN